MQSEHSNRRNDKVTLAAHAGKYSGIVLTHDCSFSFMMTDTCFERFYRPRFLFLMMLLWTWF